MYLEEIITSITRLQAFCFTFKCLQIPYGREEKGRLPNAAIKFYNATPKIFDKMGMPHWEVASL